MERTQMTFYASFWDAIDSLPKKDQLPLFRAVVSYGLIGSHNEHLSPAQNAFFALMQPNLDTSRKRAVIGKQGGSKEKANDKQNGKQNERENEKENENENEIENDCYARERAFDLFWEAYPRKVGKVKAQAAFQKVTVSVEVLLSAIAEQKKSAQWQKDNGQFIPHPATWLNGHRWEDEVVAENDPLERKLDEDDKLAIQRMLNGDYDTW